MANIKITEADRQKVRELHAIPLSFRRIGAALGLSEKTVARVIRPDARYIRKPRQDDPEPPEIRRRKAMSRASILRMDEGFCAAMNMAIAAGTEHAHIGIIVNNDPIGPEFRLIAAAPRSSGCGSSASMCADVA